MKRTPPQLRFHAADPRHGNTRPVRAMALGITGAVHVLAVAVAAVAFNWQGSSAEHTGHTPALISLPLRPLDKPRESPEPGAIAPAPATPAVAMTPQQAPLVPTAPLTPDIRTASAVVSGGEPGGRSDDLSQVTLAYRRAIMGRLEAQRRYPEGPLRSGRQGAGTVLFHIERSGQLIGASVMTSTGLPALDAAALDIVRRAAPFPAIPDGLPDELAITLPVDFLIDHPAILTP